MDKKERYPNCQERIGKWYQDRMADVRSLSQTGVSEDGETYLDKYGLSFDYVKAGTFDDQRQGYWRWQLSWGGPSDEFRFFWIPNGSLTVEYWFMDWFDGAVLTPPPEDREILKQVFYTLL